MHHEKLFIDSVIHQSTVLLAGFLLYFTILGNSFWQKRFLNLFFQKCYSIFIGNRNLLFSFHTAITILPNGGIEAMDTTEGLQKNILDATLRVFDQKGLKFTMDDLAKELSISKKTIYTVYMIKKHCFLPW